MRLLLHRGPTHLQVLSRHDIREFRDVGAARDFLRPLLADPLNLAGIILPGPRVSTLLLSRNRSHDNPALAAIS